MSNEFEQPDFGKPKFFDKIALFSAVVSLLCVLGAHAIELAVEGRNSSAALAGARDAGDRLFPDGVDRRQARNVTASIPAAIAEARHIKDR